MPDSKVALFIDFDNIRIGIRQHFGGELHPSKLMAKASKYGRVTTAKAYADFTGHPKEFQDKLLFAAGIEPIHAPSKLSGGRRQSSADMHMVIDMLLEAVDHEDVDTYVLMTGDADFLRMVATLRRRFGKKVVISGVQSTSTSLDLMNAADVRDPITKQDSDMTGELGRLTRPLVTRADLDAEAAADEAATRPTSGLGGIFKGLFGSKKPAAPMDIARTTQIAPPPAPPAPRRLRATELRRGAGTTIPATPATRTAPTRTGRSASAPAARPVAPRTSARGQQPARELPPVGPDGRPDEVEQRIVREIYQMPPGRMGYTTMKTIEEVLRSKAGQMGSTRKEIPARLDRLVEMGMFKRETHQRGSGQVEVGELVESHPQVAELTAGLARAEAPPRTERAPRAPRLPRGPRPEAAEPGLETADGGETAPVAFPEAPTELETPATPAAEPQPVEEPAQPFRWVSGVESSPEGETEAPAAAAEEAAATKPKRAPRRASTPRGGTSRSRKKPTEDAEPAPEAPAASTDSEPPPI